MLAVNHNIQSWFARALGERCPMYDVEHIHLFSPSTVARLLGQCGFQVRRASGIDNAYTCQYVLKMFPMPRSVRILLTKFTAMLRIADRSIMFPAGNMVAVAAKPANA